MVWVVNFSIEFSLDKENADTDKMKYSQNSEWNPNKFLFCLLYYYLSTTHSSRCDNLYNICPTNTIGI